MEIAKLLLFTTEQLIQCRHVYPLLDLWLRMDAKGLTNDSNNPNIESHKRLLMLPYANEIRGHGMKFRV